MMLKQRQFKQFKSKRKFSKVGFESAKSQSTANTYCCHRALYENTVLRCSLSKYESRLYDVTFRCDCACIVHLIYYNNNCQGGSTKVSTETFDINKSINKNLYSAPSRSLLRGAPYPS